MGIKGPREHGGLTRKIHAVRAEFPFGKETLQVQPNFILAGFTTKLVQFTQSCTACILFRYLLTVAKYGFSLRLILSPLCGMVSAIFLSELLHYFLSPALDKHCCKIFQYIRIEKRSKRGEKMTQTHPFVFFTCN